MKIETLTAPREVNPIAQNMGDVPRRDDIETYQHGRRLCLCRVTTLQNIYIRFIRWYG